MTRRTIRLLVVILILSVLVVLPAAEAQGSGQVYRIGYMAPGTGPNVLTETFRQGLRDLGYVEGQNLVIEYRWTGGGTGSPSSWARWSASSRT